MEMRKEKEAVYVEHVGGGAGKVEIHHIMNEDEFLGDGRMFARLVLEPGNVVGWHEHQEEAEYYYILSGEGEFTDSDHQTHSVKAGDFCPMKVGSGHALANTGKVPLIFFGLILFAEAKRK
ncbi:MAG: cupin domain-containing protein [Hydrogenoanaerobacterium sp.]